MVDTYREPKIFLCVFAIALSDLITVVKTASLVILIRLCASFFFFF